MARARRAAGAPHRARAGMRPRRARRSAPGTTKIARQSNAWVRAPPSAGPTALATTVAYSHSWRASRLATSSENAAISAADPPTAWKARATSSTPSELAAAHAERCHGEQREPGRARARRPDAAHHALGRDQREDEHDRVDADHRGDPVDRRVQVDEDVGQRERDDRGVCQREACGDGDQEVASAHGSDSLPCPANHAPSQFRRRPAERLGCDPLPPHDRHPRARRPVA